MGKRKNGDLAGGSVDGDFGYYVPRAYWASRLAPYAAQWAALPATWLIGEGSHLWLSDPSVLPWVTPGLALLGTGLSALTWTAAKARGAFTRYHATATTALTTGWLTAATVTGVTTTPALAVWLFGGATVALSWNIRRALSSGNDDAGTGGLFEKVKLAGVQAGPVQVGPNRVEVPLALTSAETTVGDVQAKADNIGQQLKLHRGAVRIVGDPDDLSQATMTVVPNDVLRTPTPWPGLSNPGGSIADPLMVGVYEDGEPQQIWLPGDKKTHRNATHYVVQGMNGAGKTKGAKIAWTEILSRRDAMLIVLDPSKGEQSVKFLGDNAYVITGHKACQDFMTRVPDAITAQANQLGQWGYDEWTPEVFERHGLPYLVLWVEEAPRVLEDAATVTRIVQEARSAGMSVFLSLQKASFRQMSTDTRSQLGGVWCYGVNDISDAAYTLSDEVIDAGARPDRWKNRRPGCNYIEGPGITEERFAVPGRTFDTGPDDSRLQVAIEATRPCRPALHPITAQALGLPVRPAKPVEGQEMTSTTTSGTGAAVPSTAQDQPSWTRYAAPRPARAGVDTDFDGPDLSDLDDAEPVEIPADPEPDLDVEGGADAELPVDEVDMPLPRPRPTRSEARAMLLALVQQLLAERGQFSVRDLPEPDEIFGRGRTWLSTELARMAGEGVLEAAGMSGNATVYRAPTRHAA